MNQGTSKAKAPLPITAGLAPTAGVPPSEITCRELVQYQCKETGEPLSIAEVARYLLEEGCPSQWLLRVCAASGVEHPKAVRLVYGGGFETIVLFGDVNIKKVWKDETIPKVGIATFMSRPPHQEFVDVACFIPTQSAYHFVTSLNERYPNEDLRFYIQTKEGPFWLQENREERIRALRVYPSRHNRLHLTKLEMVDMPQKPTAIPDDEDSAAIKEAPKKKKSKDRKKTTGEKKRKAPPAKQPVNEEEESDDEDSAAMKEVPKKKKKTSKAAKKTTGEAQKETPDSPPASPKETAPPKTPKAAKKKDDGKPKRSKTAYLFFSDEVRPELIKANDGKFDISEVSKELGRRWKESSDKDKKKYQDMAAAAKESHKEKMANWEAEHPDEVKKARKKTIVEEAAPAPAPEPATDNSSPPSSPKRKKSKKAVTVEAEKETPDSPPASPKKTTQPKTPKAAKKNDEDGKPKRPRTGFLLFSDKVRPEVIKAIDGKPSLPEVSKEIGRRWKETSDKDKKKYQDLAAPAMKIYMEKKAKWEAEHPDEVKKAGKKTIIGDDAMPRRSKTAYIYFCDDVRPEIVKANGGEFSMSEVSKELGRRWKETSDEDKKKFQDLADAAKEIYLEKKNKWEAEHPDEVKNPKKKSSTEEKTPTKKRKKPTPKVVEEEETTNDSDDDDSSSSGEESSKKGSDESEEDSSSSGEGSSDGDSSDDDSSDEETSKPTPVKKNPPKAAAATPKSSKTVVSQETSTKKKKKPKKKK